MTDSVKQDPDGSAAMALNVSCNVAEDIIATETHNEASDVDKLNTNSAFAYLDRDNFTSEKFKIVLRNLPKYFGMSEIKKLINKKLNLQANKVKQPKGGRGDVCIYVCFRSEEARLNGFNVLNGFVWKGSQLRAELSSAVPDPLVKKRLAEVDQASGAKRPRLSVSELSMKIKDACAPLWRHSYEKQLEIKTDKIAGVLRKFSAELVAANPELEEWINLQESLNNGLPCPLLPIRPSPVVDGYRNKCEFTIGINESTGEKTVGLRVSSYAQGSLCVVSPSDVPHVPDIMKKVCVVSEKFIRSSSLDTYNQETHEGCWKSITVRYGFRTNELMVIFLMHPQQLTADQQTEVCQQLREFFASEEADGLNVHSLLLGTQGRGREKPAITLISGQPHIYEEICGCRFRISPLSFFQVNTEAAEVLYDSIAELSGLTPESALIDVCCGAGTIGICLAKKCGKVLGLEILEEAVQDAEQNAAYNAVGNAQFFAGAAEDILGTIVKRAEQVHNVIAVVDPPRAGLGKSAVIQLRQSVLEQFVYASCNPSAAKLNFVAFGRPESKQYPNGPFVPVRCVPVDLFPHTDSCELVIFFKRYDSVRAEFDAASNASLVQN